MFVRPAFVQRVVEEHELGQELRGPWSIDRRALISRIDGEAELFLEHGSGFRGAPRTGARYVHIPANGLPALLRVCDAVLEARPPDGVSVWERLARPIVRLALLGPVLAVLIAPVATLFAYLRGMTGDGLAFVTFGSFGATLVLGMAVGYSVHWLVARSLGEAPDVTFARVRHRWVRDVSPLGTFQGLLGKNKRPLGSDARLHVMRVHRGLVVSRLAWTWLGFRVGAYFIPEDQVPTWRHAAVRVQELRALGPVRVAEHEAASSLP